MAEAQESPPPAQPTSSEPRLVGQRNGFIGKHRLTAAIARLNQEIEALEKELEELDQMGMSSAVCQEVVSRVETAPDALLPITRGPANAAWDRWFEGSHGSRSHKWWLHKRLDSS